MSHTPQLDAQASAEMFQRLGEITRQLHDALHELGYAPALKDAANELPDARSRLEYIARLTGEAADKVLNRVDEAKAEQAQVLADSQALQDTIGRVPGLKWAMPELLEWSARIHQRATSTDQHLTEIMMAQDFHDLTGQVINKVVTLAANIEQQLVALLLHAVPAQAAQVVPNPPAGAPARNEALNGPVVNPEGRTDVVTDQSQVDDLLASLGF